LFAVAALIFLTTGAKNPLAKQEELVADLIATYGSEIIEITNRVFKKIKGAY